MADTPNTNSSTPSRARKTTNKAAAKKAPAKKSTAKKSTAKKSTAKKAAAKKSTAARKPAAAKSVEDSPAARYLMGSIDAASSFADDITSAGTKLADQLQDLGNTPALEIPDKVVKAVTAAVESNDVGQFLDAQQQYAETVQSWVDDANDKYQKAVDTYSKSCTKVLDRNQQAATRLFTDYVADVTKELDERSDDPVAVAQLGWALILASHGAPYLATAAS